MCSIGLYDIFNFGWELRALALDNKKFYGQSIQKIKRNWKETRR